MNQTSLTETDRPKQIKQSLPCLQAARPAGRRGLQPAPPGGHLRQQGSRRVPCSPGNSCLLDILRNFLFNFLILLFLLLFPRKVSLFPFPNKVVY